MVRLRRVDLAALFGAHERRPRMLFQDVRVFPVCSRPVRDSQRVVRMHANDVVAADWRLEWKTGHSASVASVSPAFRPPNSRQAGMGSRRKQPKWATTPIAYKQLWLYAGEYALGPAEPQFWAETEQDPEGR